MTPDRQGMVLESHDREVRIDSETYLSEGSVPRLIGEDVVPHRLDVSEATLQWAGDLERCRSRDVASKFYGLDRAAHRVASREQKVRLLLERMGLTLQASLPRLVYGVEKQQAA